MADPEFTVRRRNSEWADTFGGATTNLAQRQRYAKDQEVYADDLLKQRQQVQTDLLMKDRNAQNFYFKQQELDRKQQMDQFGMTLKHNEEQRKNALLPLQMEAERAKQDAAIATTQARLNKERRDAQNAARVALDTDGFEDKAFKLMQEAAPGTEDFAKGMLAIVASHPYVPSDLRKTWMTQANIKNDPDQLMRETEAFRKTHSTALTKDDKGQWEIRLTEKAPAADLELKGLEKERALYATEFDKARTRRMQAQKLGDVDVIKAADADVTDYQNKLSEVENRLKGKAPQEPSTAATTTTSAIPSDAIIKQSKTTGKYHVFNKDGSYVGAFDNKDGGANP